MTTLLTWFILLTVFVFLPTGLAARHYLRLRRQAASAAQAQDAARHAQSRAALAELNASAIGRQFTAYKDALDSTDQQRVKQALTQSRPMQNPPPGVWPLLRELDRVAPDDPYAAAYGWETVDGEASVVALSLHGDSPAFSGSMTFTGRTGAGKDWAMFCEIACILARTTPQQVQIYYIDGKRSDGALLRNLPHNWQEPALEPEQVLTAFDALRAERERRERDRVELGVTKWEEIPEARRPPLLVAYISELTILDDYMRKAGRNLEDELEREATTIRASGIRFRIGTQDMSNMRTRWRRQMSTDIAGWQKSEDAVKPNTGLTANEIRSLGGISPTDLAGMGPGYFTVINGRSVATVRTPYLKLEDRVGFLDWYREQYADRLIIPKAVERSQLASPPPAPPAGAVAESAAPRSMVTEEQIRQWAREGIDQKELIRRIGGRRQRASARMKLALGEPLSEAEERELSSVLSA